MSDGFPSSPPPPPPVSSPIVTSRNWWQSWWLITAVAVILIVGAAALIASNTGGDGGPASTPTDAPLTTVPVTDPATATTDPTTAPAAGTTPASAGADAPITPTDAVDPASTDVPADVPADTATTPSADEIDGAPVGAVGDRLSPVVPGEIADIGNGWRLQVLGVVEDGTALVLAENQFNEPPRAGTKFTLVEIALGYYGLDDPASAFIPTISGVASASVELDEDCGVIPDDVRSFADIFSGGVVRGNVCYVTVPADDGTVQLYATTTFDGSNVFLDASSEPAAATPMPTLRGPQPGARSTPGRLDPLAVGTPVEVGEGWSLTVTGPATDITDVVAAENQFNDPPPDGFRFVGIDVEYRFDGESVSNAFEVSTKVVGDGNVELAKGCGVIPNAVDVFADVFAGGVESGTLCFVTPVDDIGTLVLYASTGFDGETFMFATG